MLNVILNLALFALKFIGGTFSHSVSVISDAFNNLTDAATTLFAWFGVKISAIGAGEKHPNGHGRFDWIIALISSTAVIVVGWELLTESVSTIKSLEKPIFGVFTVIALAVSIGVKSFMFLYNKKKSKENNSSSLKTVSVDCLSDAVSTSVVLISLIVSTLFPVNIDGWCGILVSIFIMYNGFSALSETSERIMGKSASKEHLAEIKNFALENSDFQEIANLQVEDYGYGRFRTSMTAIGKYGVSDERLLSDIADLKYKIYHKYGYNVQIVAQPSSKPDEILLRYLSEVLSSFAIPLQLYSLRTSNAGNYILAEPEISFDFRYDRDKEGIEKRLSEKFDRAPDGYRIIPHLILKRMDKWHYEQRAKHHYRNNKQRNG